MKTIAERIRFRLRAHRAFTLIREADLSLHPGDQRGPCLCGQCQWRTRATAFLKEAGLLKPLSADIRRAERRKAFVLIAILLAVSAYLAFLLW